MSVPKLHVSGRATIVDVEFPLDITDTMIITVKNKDGVMLDRFVKKTNTMTYARLMPMMSEIKRVVRELID